jgi:hypothetical protein
LSYTSQASWGGASRRLPPEQHDSLAGHPTPELECIQCLIQCIAEGPASGLPDGYPLHLRTRFARGTPPLRDELRPIHKGGMIVPPPLAGSCPIVRGNVETPDVPESRVGECTEGRRQSTALDWIGEQMDRGRIPTFPRSSSGRPLHPSGSSATPRSKVLRGKLIAIGCAVRVDCSVGLAFHGDGGHGDDRNRGQPLFEIVVFPLAVGQAEVPAVLVDRDGDMVRVVE